MKPRIKTESEVSIQEQLAVLQKQIACAASTGHSFRVSEATKRMGGKCHALICENCELVIRT